MDRPKRAAAAAAAAAISTRQQPHQQQQQKRKQQKSQQQEEEEEDAALPAEEPEIGDEDSGSESNDSSANCEAEQSDDEGEEGTAEQTAEDEQQIKDDAAEDEQSGGADEGASEGGEAEASSSASEADEGEAAETEAGDDGQEQEQDEEEGDDAGAETEADAGADSTPAASQQQEQDKQSGKPATKPPKVPQRGRPAAGKAATKLVLKTVKDYSYVLELPKHEQAALVSQADKIRKFRHSARATPAVPEPKRNKTHWDHLLEEVEWMAKEFQRERGWKLKQAKRFVRAVKASKLDVESRAEVRAQEEAAAIRRRASWIAKQVQGFWKKAERVVNYKVYVAIEARKREVLDKHLDMIVGQTEAFSKMLAQNLVGPAQPEQQQQQLALPAPPVKEEANAAAGSPVNSSRQTPRSSSMQTDTPAAVAAMAAAPSAPEQQQDVGKQAAAAVKAEQQLGEHDSDQPEDETVAALAGDLLPDAEQPAAGEALEQQQQQQQDGPAAAGSKRRRSSSGSGAATADAEGASEQRPKRARRSSAAKQQTGAAAPTAGKASAGAPGKKGSAAAAAAGDADFQSGDEQSDDDEATLEEEEKLAEADADADNELDELDAEANMPIEELLAKYGFVVPGEDADQQHHESSEEQEDDEQQHQQAADQQQDDQQQAAAASADMNQQQQQQQVNGTGMDADNDEARKAAGDDGEAMVAASRDAAAAQPTGFTLATTQVKTPVPFLLKHTLREYQHIGLDWLVSLYQKKLNGILADEMGLGKTIQTVALLAYLACEEGVWGPHLVVVPTSVMLNWEMEFKKWCPAFKLLTYYGSAKERKQKRQGWSKPHAFHVCITSYTLVLQDAKMFRRKKWKYLILDEAHMIKNWKSQRWQTLLRFNSKRRLLITGTPLQNDLMELWSLMHFLMPAVFSSHAQFKDWFSNPLTGAVETGQEVSGQLIERLHGVLRPFLLRRLKSEVEKQMPAKHEHVLTCRLSKRQRQLYDEYMARAETRAVMSGGNFMGVINVLMQLRKVCNHPDLFEGRAIISAYDMPQLSVQLPSLAMHIVPDIADTCQQLSAFGLLLGELVNKSAVWEAADIAALACSPTEFAAVAAEAAVNPAGFERDPSALYRAGAAAAQSAGLVVDMAAGAQVHSKQGYGVNGMITSKTANAIAQATDAVRQMHAQLLMSSGAAVALTNVLSQSWQKHSMWRLSRGAHCAALSLQRCGVDYAAAGQQQQQQLGYGSSRTGSSSSSSIGVVVSGGWLPTDACGVPVGTAAKGRFPDGPAFVSNAAADSKLLLPSLSASAGVYYGAAGGASGSATGAGGGFVSHRTPVCGWDLVRAVGGAAHPIAACLKGRMSSTALADLPSLILEISPTYEERAAAMEDILVWFMFAIPRARGRPVDAWCSRPDGASVRRAALAAAVAQQEFFSKGGSLRTALVRKQLFFPDRRLLQYDCGKLQELAVLLRKLKSGGHRVLIFTQMAKMLDVLEAFLNLHGHVYMRLDGSTKPEQRQVMMSRFNSDTKYFVFILSTRSGGVGINLTGADTVIFYDSDWNPAMDAQAQDRCHRIGQTREVHIYRLISANTIEENILRKSDQKRQLDWLAIQSGGFNTEMLAKLNLGGGGAGGLSADDLRAALRSAEDEDDAAAAAVAEKEVEAEMAEFTAEPPPEELKDEDLEGLEGDDAPSKAVSTRAGTPASASTVPPPPAVPTARGRNKKQHAAAKQAKRTEEGAAAATAETGTPGESEKQQQEGSAADAKEGDKEENAEDEARDLVMKDLATLQEGQSGQDLISRLSSSLKPIEQYAVKWLEDQRPVDVEAAAAAAVEDIQKEEWDLDAIEKRKEQQEAEAEDSDEVVEGWDKAAADAAYQDYQKQIAEIIAAEEEAAAAAAAEQAELAEADMAAARGASYAAPAAGYSYPGELGYDGEVADGAVEVTSPRSGRPKREAAAAVGNHWAAYGNLPSHFQQQQGSMPAWQPCKKQRGGFDEAGFGLGGAAAAGGGGRGRGRGRVGRPPGRGRGRSAAAAAASYGTSQGSLYPSSSMKDDIWDYSYGEEDDGSSNAAAVWQMLEDAGSMSSQCWLLPAAAVAEQQQIDALLPGTFASSNSKSLLPWEVQWDPLLVQIVAAVASAAAGFPADVDASDPAAAAALSSAVVDVDSWGMLEWDQVAAQMKQQIVPPVPRTALNRRVHWVSCRDRYKQLIRDFSAVQQYGQQQQQQVPAAPSTHSYCVLPQSMEQKLGNMVQTLPPGAQKLLDSVIGVTAAAAAAVAAHNSQAALQQEWQRYKAMPAAAEQQQQQPLQPVSLAAVQQLSAAVDATARSAAAAASAIAAAATAACGISTRRQSDSVKQAIGGPNQLVLAPSATQMMNALEETDGDALGAGSSVHWGAAHMQAAVLSPEVARTASLSAAAASAGLVKQGSSVAVAAAASLPNMKQEPYYDDAWGGRQQQHYPVKQQQDCTASGTPAAAASNGHREGSYPPTHLAAAGNGSLARSPSPAAAAEAGRYGTAAAAGSSAASPAVQGGAYSCSPPPAAAAVGSSGRGRGRSAGRGRGRPGRPPAGGRGTAAAAAYDGDYASEQHMQQQALHHVQYYAQQQQYQPQQYQQYLQQGSGVPTSSGAAAVAAPVALAQQQLQQQQQLISPQQLQLLLGQQAMLLQQPLQSAPQVSGASTAAVQQQQQGVNSAGAAANPGGVAVLGNGGLTSGALAALLAQQQLQQQLQMQLQQQQQGLLGQQGAAAVSHQTNNAAPLASAPMLLAAGSGGLGSYYFVNQQPVQAVQMLQAAGTAAMAAPPGSGAMAQQNSQGGVVAVNPMQLLPLQQQQQLLQLQQQQLAAFAAGAAAQHPSQQ